MFTPIGRIIASIKGSKQQVPNVDTTPLDDKEIQKELAMLFISSGGSTTLNDEIQKELAKLLIVLQHARILALKTNKESLKQKQLNSLLINVEVAIKALNSKNLILAKRLRRGAQFSVRRLECPIKAFFVNTFKDCLYLSSTTTKVIFGLALALPIHAFAPSIFMSFLSINYQYLNDYILPNLSFTTDSKQNIEAVKTSSATSSIPKQSVEAAKNSSTTSISKQNVEVAKTSSAISAIRSSNEELKEALSLLLFCAVAGSVGSIISILSRLNEYDNEKYTDELLPVFIGAFKPMIGAVFGMFVFAVTSSSFLPGTINISKTEGKDSTKWFSVISLAFVVGFSERFAKDIVSQTENRFLTPDNAKDIVTKALIEARDTPIAIVDRVVDTQAKTDTDIEAATAKIDAEPEAKAARVEAKLDPANSLKADKANNDLENTTQTDREKAEKAVGAKEDLDDAIKAASKG